MNNPYQSPESSVGGGGMVSCVGCGKELHISAALCPGCGASQRTKRYKSKTVAALFAFFLGGFGAHRFYLGQWWGIFYLLLFWAWIPGIIAFIEMFVFIFSDQKAWDEKYNEGKPAAPGDGSGATVVVVMIVGLLFLVAVIGILAAVSIPAYHDYTQRVKVSGAMLEVAPVKEKVADFYMQHKVMPSSNIMVGLDDPYILPSSHSVSVSEEGLTLEFSDESDLIDDKTIVFYLEDESGSLMWSCSGGDLPSKYRPSNCRN